MVRKLNFMLAFETTKASSAVKVMFRRLKAVLIDDGLLVILSISFSVKFKGKHSKINF